MAQRRGSVKEGEKEKEKGAKCGICIKGVGDKESGIQCELCEQWWHASCVKIPEDIYKMLDKIANLHWYCEVCNNSASKMLKSLSNLNDRMSQLELELQRKAEKVEYEKLNERLTKITSVVELQRQDTDSSLREIRKNIEEMDQSFHSALEAKLPSVVEKKVESFKDIVEQQLREEIKGDLGNSLRKEFTTPMNDEFEGVSKKIDESKQRLDELLLANKEQEDIELRRCNIILYRVEESKQVLAADRNKEDAIYCEEFMSALGNSGSGVNHEDIKKVFRLGKRNEESESPRPLLVQLVSWRAKNLVMASLYKIKSLNAKFRDITVGHDLTKKQRGECKALVEEARRRSASGDFVYKVRGLPGQWKLVQHRRV